MPKIKSSFNILLLILLFILIFPNITKAVSGDTDEVIVKYRHQLSITERTGIHRNFGSHLTDRIESLNVDVLKTDNRVKEVMNRLRLDPRIEYVEPNYIAQAYLLTNDPGVRDNYQWGLYKIDAASTGESAWNITHGNATVKVAILDTGIDSDNEDLKGKIISSKNCSDSSSADDKYGHGTHVAGIIAANTNNGIGVAGVGYQVSLVNAKALGDNGSGYYSWIADCLVWATDQGAKVINMSLGGTSSSRLLEDAINYAYSKGVVLVAAAGNSGQSAPSYPAAFENVLAVAATDINDNKASFSNFGNWVDVAAPGVNIYSTLPNHYNAFKKYYYGYLSGTSMAAPFVSGLASLLFSIDNQTNNTVLDLIQKNSDQITGTGNYWQYGRINAYKSLLAANSSSIIPTPTIIILPTSTPIPIPTPTNTPVPTTPTPTSSPAVTQDPAKNPRNRLCARFPSLCK